MLVSQHNSRNENERKKGRAGKIRRRLRDPFNKQKVKLLKCENKKIKEFAFNVQKQIVQALHVLLERNMDTSPIHVDTLQIDCTNVIGEDTSNIQDNLEFLTAEAGKLVDKLTNDKENLTSEIKKLQNTVDRCEAKIGETKDILSHFQLRFTERDERYLQSLDNMRILLEEIQNDKPDDKVCIDGTDEIRKGNIQSEDYEFLPLHAKHLVSRLVSRFGNNGLLELRKTLNASAVDEEEEVASRDVNMPVKPLTKTACTELLLDWMNRSASHDGRTLFSLIHTRRIKDCSVLSKAEHPLTEPTILFDYEPTVGSMSSHSSDDSFQQHIIAKEPFDKECYFSNTSLEKERLQFTNKYADVVSV